METAAVDEGYGRSRPTRPTARARHYGFPNKPATLNLVATKTIDRSNILQHHMKFRSSAYEIQIIHMKFRSPHEIHN
jgi:hypothetical protein